MPLDAREAEVSALRSLNTAEGGFVEQLFVRKVLKNSQLKWLATLLEILGSHKYLHVRFSESGPDIRTYRRPALRYTSKNTNATLKRRGRPFLTFLIIYNHQAYPLRFLL